MTTPDIKVVSLTNPNHPKSWYSTTSEAQALITRRTAEHVVNVHLAPDPASTGIEGKVLVTPGTSCPPTVIYLIPKSNT